MLANRQSTRRRLLLAGGVLLGRAAGQSPAALHVAGNQYPWGTYYRRENRDPARELDAALGEAAAAGLNGFEPLARSAGDVRALVPLLRKHQLEMRSLYVNSTLHDPGRADQSIAEVLGIAAEARAAGVRIVVTNPSPLGDAEAKTDEQLRFQARALGRLGEALRAQGLTLAYHNHAPELRHAAREFHHMMLATDPKVVRLCLDAHWIYRGSGNSVVALFDIVEMYAHRIAELHLRQSRNGVWTETFGEGDIDYAVLARRLAALRVRPHLVLEQAVEEGTPHTMTGLEAHRIGQAYVRKLFG